ncbi:hypothetical protein [Geomicrobium sp. JCM 19039]|nr:hypothetical protein [Geomicrobium sp. JCM 19039]GAK11950.1 hypothetical protein JCM19039_1675 [Geomicrobium sp. JCM 19039]
MIDDKFRTLTERAIASNNEHSYQIINLLHHQWEEIKSSYRSKNAEEESGEEEQQPQEPQEDPLVSEAHKLFGEELVEIVDDAPPKP